MGVGQSLITLTTDFGTRDPFAGIVKGVIASINPEAVVIDLTHGISAQNVREGAFALLISARYFPKGTVHVAVVDPGVGGGRRAIAARTDDFTFVGPDNGILTWAIGNTKRAVIAEIKEPDYILPAISGTFHGRDIFAPAAAHLSRGVSVEDLGPPVSDPITIPFPAAERTGNEIRGIVLHIDRFGNLITNVRLTGREIVREIAVLQTRIQGLSDHYGRGKPGDAMALLGSSDFLEIAVNRGSAQKEIGAAVDDEVYLRL